MKIIKNLIAVLISALFVFGLTVNADAQRRKKVRKRIAPTATAVSNAADLRASALKVSTQLKNLNKFIYLLGGIARNIEDIDKNSGGRKVAQNETNKQNVITAIRNFRAGLIELEDEFRTKPALKNYNFQIQGISDLSAQAESQAAAGQFTESGKTMLLIVEKLSDTLVYLP